MSRSPKRRRHESDVIKLDPQRHEVYRRIFEKGFLPLRQPLLEYDEWLRREPLA
jgi:hypothetical protein